MAATHAARLTVRRRRSPGGGPPSSAPRLPLDIARRDRAPLGRRPVEGEAGPEVAESGLRVEDFGVATLTFTNGVIAVVEVTWHGTAGAGAGTRQFVGTEGQIIAGLPGAPGWLVAHADGGGWQSEEVPSGGTSALGHMIDHMVDGKPLVADVGTGLANLRACLAFYRAAAEGRAVAPSDV